MAMGIAYTAVLFMSLAVGVYQHTVPLLLMPLVSILLLVPAEESRGSSIVGGKAERASTGRTRRPPSRTLRPGPCLL